MNDSVFKPITCGQTLPQNNIHAVSVSMPKLQDVIDYEEQTPQILEKIKSAYPRFVMHPYLKILAQHIKVKYQVPDYFEVVLLSSKKAVDVVAHKYYIYNKIPYFDENINEPFGVILVRKNSRQLKKVLQFIQHVGYNLSSRLAEDYLFDIGLLDSKQDENLYEKNDAKDVVINSLAKAYNQPSSNVSLAPSGMNAVYSAIKGAKSIGAKNGRTIIIQLGWLYLDTMNIVDHYYERIKKFLDVKNLNILEEYLQTHGFQVSSIITEIPTNPRVEVPVLQDLREALNKPRTTPAGNAAIAPVFIIDQTFCPNVQFLKPKGIFEGIKTLAYVSGSKFPSGGKCTAGYCVSNDEAKDLMTTIEKHLILCDNGATPLQINILAQQMPSMLTRIEAAYRNTREFVSFIQAELPNAKINFVSDQLAATGFTPSVFSLDLPARGNTPEDRELHKRELNHRLIDMMITGIPDESKYCVSYGQLKGCYWTIPATSTQGTTKEGDKDYIARVSVSPDLDLEKHKEVFKEFVNCF